MPEDTKLRYADWAPVALRLALGVVFAAHGSQKVFGWFGGAGISQTAQFLGGMGLHPAILWAVLVAAAEFGGGLLLLLGLVTRFAAAAIFINMTVATFLVHFKNGFFMSNGGFEYTFTLALGALALVLAGGGRLSIDRKIGWKL